MGSRHLAQKAWVRMILSTSPSRRRTTAELFSVGGKEIGLHDVFNDRYEALQVGARWTVSPVSCCMPNLDCCRDCRTLHFREATSAYHSIHHLIKTTIAHGRRHQSLKDGATTHCRNLAPVIV